MHLGITQATIDDSVAIIIHARIWLAYSIKSSPVGQDSYGLPQTVVSAQDSVALQLPAKRNHGYGGFGSTIVARWLYATAHESRCAGLSGRWARAGYSVSQPQTVPPSQEQLHVTQNSSQSSQDDKWSAE